VSFSAVGQRWSLLAGVSARRDAPRGLNLARADDQGVFHLVTSNGLTIIDLSPYAALNGQYGRDLEMYLGVRRDQNSVRQCRPVADCELVQPVDCSDEPEGKCDAGTRGCSSTAAGGVQLWEGVSCK
jgi:hypothetical protein